jgi:hypothetical protein
MRKERLRNLEDQKLVHSNIVVIENGMIKMTVGVGPQNSSTGPGNFDNLLPHKLDDEGRHHKQIDGLIKC